MNDCLRVQDSASCQVIRAPRKPTVEDLLRVSGIFRAEHWRGGKLIGVHEAPNLVMYEGRSKLLDVMFHGETPITAWYVGLILTGATPVVGDTYASHAGWTELTTQYSQAERVPWVEAAAAGTPPQTDNSASPAIFDIVTGCTVYGLCLVGGGTDPEVKGDAAGGGTLWCATDFDPEVAVVDGDQLKVTYTAKT